MWIGSAFEATDDKSLAVPYCCNCSQALSNSLASNSFEGLVLSPLAVSDPHKSVRTGSLDSVVISWAGSNPGTPSANIRHSWLSTISCLIKVIWIKAALPAYLFNATMQKLGFSNHHASMLPRAGCLSIHIASLMPGFKVTRIKRSNRLLN